MSQLKVDSNGRRHQPLVSSLSSANSTQLPNEGLIRRLFMLDQYYLGKESDRFRLRVQHETWLSIAEYRRGIGCSLTYEGMAISWPVCMGYASSPCGVLPWVCTVPRSARTVRFLLTVCLIALADTDCIIIWARVCWIRVSILIVP